MMNISARNNHFRGLGKKAAFFCLCLGGFFAASSCLWAQDIADKNDKALFGKAQSLNNTSSFEEAREILEGLYEKYSGHKEIAMEFIKAAGYSRHGEQALRALDKFEQENPVDEGLRYLRATILEANDRLGEAREQYLKILEENPGNDQLFIKIADLANWTGDFSAAEEYYRKIISRPNYPISVLIRLGDVLRYQGKDEEALKFYDQYLQSANAR